MKTTEKTLLLPAGLEFEVEFIDDSGGDLAGSIKSVVGPLGWVDAQWSRKWLLGHCEIPEEEDKAPKRAKRRKGFQPDDPEPKRRDL